MKARILFPSVFRVNAVFIYILFICSLVGGKRKDLEEHKLSIAGLKCEYATNPVGIDIPAPQFSWEITSEDRGVSQSAYQILVTDSPQDLAQGKGTIWNSGKVRVTKSAGIKYAGPALVSRKRYFWKVKIWDSDDISSGYSHPAFFEMGLTDQKDWKAEWIGYPASFTGRVLYFRKTFSIAKPVKRARAYIAGLGYYELHINGKKVGNHVLDPGASDYSKRVLYATYDIADFLHKENAIGVIAGPGWYGIPVLRMQTEITYEDGSTETIVTAPTWRVAVGPTIKSSIYDGEYYDARKENPGWDLTADTIHHVDQNIRWVTAGVTTSPGGRMIAQKLEPIKVVDSLSPKRITEPIPGVYVVDVGQNLAGWASLKVEGKAGTKISLKFAEVLNKDGTINQDNLRMAKAMDTYILKGGGMEQWQPKFTYHGFRYVQIEGYPHQLKEDDVQIMIVRSAVDQTGKFRCSNEVLNRIHEMIRWTEASNLTSIPTDCPQRNERLGWLNDMTVRIDEAIYNYNLSRFYPKWINDIEDTQAEDGSITDTAPFRWGNRPADPVSASYLLLALRCYEFYGNKGILNDHYAGLKAWVDYLNSRTVDGIVDYSSWGDWSPPVEFGVGGGPVSKFTPGKLMSTGYLYYCARMLSRMADILGKDKDKNSYENLALHTADAFNKKYWDEEKGGYGSNNQACNSFALFLGLVSKPRIPRVVENLVTDVKNHDYHLTTGNQCTKYLMEVLTEYGHAEVAYKIATQDSYPSWGFMLANGATTLWERWENSVGGGMNSHNHPMMGSVDSWFYKYVAGILPGSGGAGFEKFVIHPYIIDDLKFAEGELNSVKGVIKSAWRKEQGAVYLDVTIPGNSQALVYVPANKVDRITESNKNMALVKSAKFIRKEGEYVIFQVGSGSYHFKSDWQTDHASSM